MKKGSKERLFEVMGRLDKTFKPTLSENKEETKPKLSEGFEEIEPNDDEINVPAENGEENSMEDAPEMEEKTPEEKLQDITAKVDEIYALIHGDDSEEVSNDIPAEQPEEIETETGEIDADNLQETELDEHHLKDRKSQEDFICKNDKSCKKEDLKDLSDEEVKKKYNAIEKKMGIVD